MSLKTTVITQEEIGHKDMPIVTKTKTTKKTSCPTMLDTREGQIVKKTEGKIQRMTPERKTLERKTPERKTPERKTPERKTTETKTLEKKTPFKKTLKRSESLYDIQLPSETKQLFRQIEETDDVKELIQMYEDISGQYRIRSFQIDNIIKTPIPEDQVPMFKSYLKDFVFFAPCIRRLRESEEEFIKTLLKKLRSFSETVEEKKTVNRDMIYMMMSYISFVKNLPEKEDVVINDKINLIQKELDFTAVPYNEPSLLWNAMNGDFIEIIDSLEAFVDRGITCDMLFQRLEEVFRMISEEDPASIDSIPQMKEGIRRFLERQFYME